MTNTDFSENFAMAVPDHYPRIVLYLNQLPTHMEQGGFEVEGYLLAQDDTGVALLFLYNGNEPRIYKFMNHIITMIQTVNIAQTLEELGIEV